MSGLCVLLVVAVVGERSVDRWLVVGEVWVNGSRPVVLVRATVGIYADTNMLDNC